MEKRTFTMHFVIFLKPFAYTLFFNIVFPFFGNKSVVMKLKIKIKAKIKIKNENKYDQVSELGTWRLILTLSTYINYAINYGFTGWHTVFRNFGFFLICWDFLLAEDSWERLWLPLFWKNYFAFHSVMKVTNKQKIPCNIFLLEKTNMSRAIN